MGDVVGDLNSQRRQVQSMDSQLVDVCVVFALVPLAENFGYVNTLRSRSVRCSLTTMCSCYSRLRMKFAQTHD